MSVPTGHFGTNVTLSGTNFNPSSTVTFTFDGNPITTSPSTVTSLPSGAIPAHVTFLVPSAAKGSTHAIRGTTGTITGSAPAFTVTQFISLSPTTGPKGTPVTVTGDGFAGTSTATILFSTAHLTAVTTSTDSNGHFSTIFGVPNNSTFAASSNTVTAKDSSSNSATATFTGKGASLTLSPTTGRIGTSVTVKGVNYLPSQSFAIRFNGITQGVNATTNSTGGIDPGTTFTVPNATATTHTVTVFDGNGTGSATFTVLAPTIAMSSPTSGNAHTLVTVTGTNFVPGANVTISFGSNGPINSTIATITGTISKIIPMVGGSTITSTISGTDQVNTATSPTTFHLLTSGFALSLTTGHVGTLVTLSGHNYPPGSTQTVKYDGTTVTTFTATNAGTIPAGTAFTVPQSPLGANTVTVTTGGVTLTTNATPAATFTVSPTFSLSPTSGHLGTSVKATGNGFTANSAITVRYGAVVLGTVTTSATGTFTDTFTVPTSIGANIVSASHGSNILAVTTFTVN